MTSKERVMLASELHGLLMLPEDVLQGARDLAERRVRLHGLHDRVHEIARGPRFVTEARERARHGAPVPVPANPFESCDLGGGDLRVGGVQLDLAVGRGGRVADVAVGADLRDLTGGELLLEAVRLARDLGLEGAALHGLDDAAHPLTRAISSRICVSMALVSAS